jgi:type VI secretion system protein
MAYEDDKHRVFHLRLETIKLGNQSCENDLVSVFREQGGRIGRADDNDYVLREGSVSRTHAVITYEDGDYFLIDENSANGTYINDSPDRLEPGKAYRIRDGDRLRIGGECLIVAKLVPADGYEGYEVHDGNEEIQGMPGSAVEPSWFPHGAEDERDEVSAEGGSGEHPPVSAMKAHMPQPPLHGSAGKESAAASQEQNLDDRRTSGIRMPTGFIPGQDDYLPDEESSPGTSSADGPIAEPQSAAPMAGPAVVIPTEETASCPLEGRHAEPQPEPTQVDDDLLAALLRGLGSSALKVPPEEAIEFATQVAQLVRESMQGLIETLRLRETFKSEFSIPMTRIAKSDNNVFKHSANVDDAMRVFSVRDSGYLGPEESTRQAFEDIAADYVAMVAGMRAALSALLERFSPQVLEERIGKVTALDGVLPQIRQARLWDQFQKEYALIKGQAKEDFQRVFGQHFEEAYTEKIRELRSVGLRRTQDPES